MALSDTAMRKTKPSDKPQKLSDGAGLYLFLNPNGSRWWRFDGKRKTLSMGTYPETSLASAREKRDLARSQLQSGINPGAHRKATKAAGEENATNSFSVIAEEWLAKQQNMSPATLEKARWTLDSLVNPWVGNRPISEIDAPEMLKLLQRIEERGAHETAHRTKQRCGQIFRYAIATGRARHDPTADLRGALTPQEPCGNHRSIQGGRTAPCDRWLYRQFRGAFRPQTCPTGIRASWRVRQAEWMEFDLDAAQWRIPASKMKMRELHIVSLPNQAVAILRELQPLTGKGSFVFPGERSRQRPMSELLYLLCPAATQM